MSTPFNPVEYEFTEVEEMPEELKNIDKEGESKKKKKKRRKPKFGQGTKYKNAASNQIDKIIVRTINKTVLEGKLKKLETKDSEMGPAIMYMIDYYVSLDINHPALVVFMAGIGLMFATSELMEGKNEEGYKPKTGIEIEAEDKI